MSLVSTIREFFAGKAKPLDAVYPEQRDNRVLSYETSNLSYVFANGERYNPDDLVGAKGLQIYSRMLTDEQVKAVCEFKLNAILGRGWQFKFDGGSRLSPDEQKKRIEVFNAIVRSVRGSFVDSIDGIASGREYGFSVTEKVYGQIQHEGATFKGINMLLTRDPETFRFFTDEYGLLKRITQRVNGQQEIEIDPNKVIHYVHKPKWDLIFGRSELRAAYRAWYIKDQLVKLWAMHLERFGSGVPVATQESGTQMSKGEREALERTMKNFKAFASLILPPGVNAQVHFPTSTDQFEKALQYFDLAIAKSQLVPNLMGVSHTGQTGAYSQSQTQFQAFFWTTATDGKRLAECLNEQLFRDLGDQNWGDGDYPKFCFKPLTLDAAIQLLTQWRELIGVGAVQPTEEDERFIRELLEMPERDEDAELLVNPLEERKLALQEEQIKAENQFRERELQRPNQPARMEAVPVSVTVNNPAPPRPPPPEHTATGPVGAAVVPHGELRSASRAGFTRATQRVAFSVIERRTDSFAESAIPQVANIVAKAVKRALGDDANMTQLLDEDPSDIASIDLHGSDRGRLKSEYKELLMSAWALGSNLAANELDRARGERTELSVRREKFASLRDNAAAWFESHSFRMAGDTSDQVRKIIQQELENSLKFGKTIEETRIAIWERLIERGLTTFAAVKGVETNDAVQKALEDLLIDELDDVPAYLNTLVRTNTFEALNEARFAEFTDPAVGDFVLALEYAAVLDSSTTEICRELNGKVYRADSEEWDRIRPPNHFNCRSVLVPVTVIDEWDGQESPPPTVDPAEGFA